MEKPGYKTTEFWLSAGLALVGPLVTILVGMGIIGADDASTVTDTITTSATGITEAVMLVVANLTSVMTVRKYIGARVDVKKAA